MLALEEEISQIANLSSSIKKLKKEMNKINSKQIEEEHNKEQRSMKLIAGKQ